MTTPGERAQQPVTLTVPYWVATRIRTAMQREADNPEGCRCPEHYDLTVTEPETAYAYVAEQMDLAYAESAEHDNTTNYETEDVIGRAQRAHTAIRHHERLRDRLSDIRAGAVHDMAAQAMTTTEIGNVLGVSRSRAHQILYPNGKETS